MVRFDISMYRRSKYTRMSPDLAAWLAAVAAVVGVLVSLAALRSSNAALRASTDAKMLDQRIELSLANFRQDLMNGDYFAQQRIIDEQIKGIREREAQLDHRMKRNSEHVSMILAVLLKQGIGADTVARMMDPMNE